MKRIQLEGNTKKFTIIDGLYLLVIALFSGVCYELFYRMCIRFNDKYRSDFEWYINLPTSEYKEKHRLIGWALDLMYRNGIEVKGMVVMFAVTIACIILVNYAYISFFTKDISKNRTARELFSGIMLFIGPIYVPVIHEYYYRWSFQSFAWHSPTQQEMILFSIISVICFVKLYENSEDTIAWKWWIATAITVFLSTFSKPAFAIDLMLATVVLFLMDLFVRNGEKLSSKFVKRFLMGLSLVPSAIYLLIIVKYNFNGEDELQQASVNFTIEHLKKYPNLGAAIVCGLAFSIVVWLANTNLLKEKRYRTIIVIFVIGVLQWSVLREGGVRERHGNFAWGRQVACYLLTLTSIAIAINNWNEKDFLKDKALIRKLYFALLGFLLILHVGSQLRYFYMICRGHSYLC